MYINRIAHLSSFVSMSMHLRLEFPFIQRRGLTFFDAPMGNTGQPETSFSRKKRSGPSPAGMDLSQSSGTHGTPKGWCPFFPSQPKVKRGFLNQKSQRVVSSTKRGHTSKHPPCIRIVRDARVTGHMIEVKCQGAAA